MADTYHNRIEPVKENIVHLEGLEELDWNREHSRSMRALGDWVTALQATLPRVSASIPETDASNPSGSNTVSLPSSYVCPDSVASLGLLTDDLFDSFLESPPDGAIIRLDYSEGFPTVQGLPFWERLDGEPLPYYKIFKVYRDMELTTEGKRSFQKAAQRARIPVRVVEILSKVYHWRSRVKAFDLYRAIEQQQIRNTMIRDMETTHGKAAKTIFERCNSFLEDNAELLDPKTALAWLETAVKLQRLSLGLHPDKPSTPGESSDGRGHAPIYVNTMIANSGDGDNQGLPAQPDQGKDGEEKRVREILEILHGAGVLPRGFVEGLDAKEAEYRMIDEEIEDLD